MMVLQFANYIQMVYALCSRGNDQVFMHSETEMGHIWVRSLIIMCPLNIHTLKGETTHSFIISCILDSVSCSPLNI